MKNTFDSDWERFWGELSLHWLRYVALCVTGSLTGLAAWNLTQNYLYVLAIVAMAEGAALYWALRVEDYGNHIQQACSYIGAVLAWSAITVTDLASATIIASMANIKIFSAFEKVPVWAQSTVVYVVPLLAVLHGVLATLHYFFSETAKAHREISEIKRNMNIDIEKSHAKRLRELAETGSINEGYRRAEEDWQSTASTASTVKHEETVNSPILPPSKK